MERWRDIDEFNGSYQVSDSGRIRSIPRNGTVSEYRILKPRIDKYGYQVIGLHTVSSGKRTIKNRFVHRLVLLSFIPNPSSKTQVNHINGIRDDNRLENLEWSTPSENRLHAIHDLGARILRGEEIASSTLTSADVLNIHKLNSSGISKKEIGATYSINVNYINRILSGDRWKHLHPDFLN